MVITSHHVGGVLLAPLLATQGVVTRIVVPKLPEPACPRSGSSGCGPSLRLLVLGDSAAAGVGATNQADALTGQILAGLTDHYTVHWRIEATTGATTADTLKRLATLPIQTFDVAVTSLGVNDVTRGRRVGTWILQQRALVGLLRRRLGVDLVLLSALPPVHLFPALPQPLRWFLGSRTRYFDRALARFCATTADCEHLKPEFSRKRTTLASDGFHPGPGVYREWAAAVVERIRAARPPAGSGS
jgi:lysophospholipase L1-like esterase